jgi:hypothetical protein
MDQSTTPTIDRAHPANGTILDALGLGRTAAGLNRLAKIQGLERTIATLRAENLALRIHVQELERLILETCEDRPDPAADARENGHPA